MSWTDHVDDQIVMLGCQPWPPKANGKPCPVCDKGINPGDDSIYCACCDSTSPAISIRLEGERLRAERIRRDEDGLRRCDQEMMRFFEERSGDLTERERRRIWYGIGCYQETPVRTSKAKPLPIDHHNPAWLGRRFLRMTKQEPDWSLILSVPSKRSAG